MLRRIHVPRLAPGELPLDAAAAHHMRDVLRLADGATVQVFDDSGATAEAILAYIAGHAVVRVQGIRAASDQSPRWHVAAAIPKGPRADWMVEKLSELGTSTFIPLRTARGIVLPAGENKRQRWMRISTESAKQSRRSGVMQIMEMTGLDELLKQIVEPEVGWYCSTNQVAVPIAQRLSATSQPMDLTLVIGPEGGWTDEEETLMQQSIAAVKLTQTILRVETAAIAAAAVVAMW